jgi:hypothetical protein
LRAQRGCQLSVVLSAEQCMVVASSSVPRTACTDTLRASLRAISSAHPLHAPGSCRCAWRRPRRSCGRSSSRTCSRARRLVRCPAAAWRDPAVPSSLLSAPHPPPSTLARVEHTALPHARLRPTYQLRGGEHPRGRDQETRRVPPPPSEKRGYSIPPSSRLADGCSHGLRWVDHSFAPRPPTFSSPYSLASCAVCVSGGELVAVSYLDPHGDVVARGRTPSQNAFNPPWALSVFHHRASSTTNPLSTSTCEVPTTEG